MGPLCGRVWALYLAIAIAVATLGPGALSSGLARRQFRSRKAIAHDPSIPQLEQRIVGGHNAPVIPSWMASLHCSTSSSTGFRHVCGAVLIHQQWVLTAAHCIPPDTIGPYRLQVWFGNGPNSNNTNFERHNVVGIVVHPNSVAGLFQNDVVVIKIKAVDQNRTAINWENVPLSLEKPGTMLEVSGWGTTSESSRQASSTLNTVTVPVVAKSKCIAAMAKVPIPIGDNELCAGDDDGGQDSCRGDSGGPLHSSNDLVGIISWGDGCARKGRYGVYVRVQSYKQWIREVINSNTHSP